MSYTFLRIRSHITGFDSVQHSPQHSPKGSAELAHQNTSFWWRLFHSLVKFWTRVSSNSPPQKIWAVQNLQYPKILKELKTMSWLLRIQLAAYLASWSLTLYEFASEVVFRQGRRIWTPDHMSRLQANAVWEVVSALTLPPSLDTAMFKRSRKETSLLKQQWCICRTKGYQWEFLIFCCCYGRYFGA